MDEENEAPLDELEAVETEDDLGDGIIGTSGRIGSVGPKPSLNGAC